MTLPGITNDERGWFFEVGIFVGVLTFLPSALAQNLPNPAENAPEESAKEEQADSPPFAGSREEKLRVALNGLSSESYNARVDALIKVREVLQPEDLPYLVAELKRLPNADGRYEILRFIGEIGDRRAAEAVRDELRHGKGITRRAAARALGRLKSDWAIPYLFEAMRAGDDLDLQCAAASALGELGTVRAIQSLETARPNFSGPLRFAVDRAISWAKGEIDPDRIDGDLEWGKKLTRWYKGTEYYFYAPSIRKRELKPWLIVVIHGASLNASELFDTWIPVAKETESALLVPVFEPLRFPDYRSFNFSGVRSDERLLEIVDYVGNESDLLVHELLIVGVAEGGDFVQRFVAAHPTRVARAVIEGRDFTAVDNKLYFPKGLRTTPLAPDLKLDLYRMLKSDVLFLVYEDLAGGQRAARAAESFQGSIDAVSQRSGISHRYRLMYLRRGQRGSDSVLDVSRDFLFPPTRIGSLP